MTGIEMLSVTGGLALGYWLVARSFSDKPEAPDKRAPENPKDRFQDSSRDPPAGPAQEGMQWFKVLDVPETASWEQIIIAYKKKISEYHPDKVAQMGMEIRHLAEKKSKEINIAYDHALKIKNNTEN